MLASQHIVPHEFSYYFVCPEDYATFPKVAALREWLMQQGREFAKPPLSAAAAPEAEGPKKVNARRRR